ncbi:MAG TPA: hypothetical protein VN931_06010 [Fibrobacteria bacterium]|nr:hypothetical protein [Fibrobacteria bacterium]
MSAEPILLLDPDQRLSPLLGASLSRPVVGCRTVDELVDKARSGAAFALGEVEIAGGLDGLRALGRLRREGIPVALWTSTAVDGLLPPALEEGLGLLLTKTQPLLLEEIALAVHLSERGWTPGIGKFLGKGAVVMGRESANSLTQVSALCRQVQSGLDGVLRLGRRLRLVLDELLSNAIHHSPGGCAALEWGRDAVRHVFVVRDEAGTLSPPEVLRLLDRHLRAEGLLDPRGRGLHLSRIYADRLYATVVPGRATEVAAVFWNSPGAHEGFKPVWLLESRFAGRS